ncbi:MAG: hypothetical protein KC731_24800, partial [Myxococcales bacterium]|nr:hypothetical protein [Myxococcales bacterium]
TTLGANELWVVPAAGGAAKAVSPSFATSNAQDVATFAWAPDVAVGMAYIAYIADPDVDSAFALYVADAAATTPTPVNVTPEVTDPNMDVADAQVPVFDCRGAVYFRGDFEVNDEFRLYRADIDGMNRIQVPGTMLTNGGGNASVGPVAVSPDGGQIAFAADSPDVDLYQVFTMSLSDNTPTVASAVQTTADGNLRGPSFFGDALAYSPDGTKLAVVADWEITTGVEADNDFNLFLLDLMGVAGGTRLIAVTSANNQDVNEINWARDGSRIFVMGDLVDNNDTEVYSTSDLATADQDPTTLLEQNVPAGGDVKGLFEGG